ncbi:hypothetical protein ACIQYL_20440 [Lysinibacillus xylanilyticus]|uniref:hypothetical protein n=1 Tax=Lysinibacillus xylanilyticus TaxID=582475 RepID=UPI00380974FE
MKGVSNDNLNERKNKMTFSLTSIDYFQRKIEEKLDSYRESNSLKQLNPLQLFSEAKLYVLSNHLLPVTQTYCRLNRYHIDNQELHPIFDKLVIFGHFNINMLVKNDILDKKNCLSEEEFIIKRALVVNKAIQSIILIRDILVELQTHYFFNFKNEISMIIDFIQNINRSLYIKKLQYLI